MAMKPDDKVRCSFCGKSSKQVKKMIAGLNNTYICDECVELCQEIFDEEMGGENAGEEISELHLLKPKEICPWRYIIIISVSRQKFGILTCRSRIF